MKIIKEEDEWTKELRNTFELTVDEFKYEIAPLIRIMNSELQASNDKRKHPRKPGYSMFPRSFISISYSVIGYVDMLEEVPQEKMLKHLKSMLFFSSVYTPLHKVHKYFKNRSEDTTLINIIYKNSTYKNHFECTIVENPEEL